jgi:hypothetical protein
MLFTTRLRSWIPKSSLAREDLPLSSVNTFALSEVDIGRVLLIGRKKRNNGRLPANKRCHLEWCEFAILVLGEYSPGMSFDVLGISFGRPELPIANLLAIMCRRG